MAGFNAGGTADHCKISVPEYSHVFRDFLYSEICMTTREFLK